MLINAPTLRILVASFSLLAMASQPASAAIATPRHRADPATLKNNNMPNLIGMTEAQAVQALAGSTASGHKIKLIVCDNAHKGKVSQTLPPAGYPIQPDRPVVEMIICRP